MAARKKAAKAAVSETPADIINEISGDGIGPAPLPEILSITKVDLLSAIIDYVIDSKAGDTMNYRDTAALDVGTFAQSSADVLWGKLKAQGPSPQMSLALADQSEPVPLVFDQFSGRDLLTCVEAGDGSEFEVESRGGMLFARSVEKPQNGWFRIGKDSTGELLTAVVDDTHTIIDANASSPAEPENPNAAFF